MPWTVEEDRPSYCPRCGRELGERAAERRSLPHRPACDRTLYRNPTPMGRATVVGPAEALLIRHSHAVETTGRARPGGRGEQGRVRKKKPEPRRAIWIKRKDTA